MSDKDTIISFNTETGKTEVGTEIPLCVLVPEDSPILKEVMPEYDFENQEIGDFKTAEELASSLVETCKHYNGYGLSANQVGIKTRVFVMGTGDNYIACFNPQIVAESGEKIHLAEGCLSFPMLALKISRSAGVVVTYQDWEGKHHTQNFVGISARCFLHELDHMNGIVYTSRAKPLSLQQGLKKRGKIQHLINKAEKHLSKLPHGNSN